jgi:hypothetical protein
MREEILNALASMLPARSMHEPALSRRITVMVLKMPTKREVPRHDPVLDKISSAYNWYRDQFVKVAAQHACALPRERPSLFDDQLTDADLWYGKVASSTTELPLELCYDVLSFGLNKQASTLRRIRAAARNRR